MIELSEKFSQIVWFSVATSEINVNVVAAEITTVDVNVYALLQLVVGLVTNVKFIVWFVVALATVTVADPEALKVTGLAGKPATPV